ncbi:discoidin domain-containing protein, partial [Streptomyces sp. NPDC057674]|uniref:discoidin domain-containing protein n=1 Tax=Streptomyces sp. NPDC057674 TaxID=3346203 RepID=UPI00369FF709
MSFHHWRSRGLSAVIATSLLALGGPLMSARAAGGPNIALGDAAAASGSHAEYGAANITDGNQGTYWQSAGSTLPQWVQVDLGATTRVDEVVLKLPAGWESRNQTLSVQGSADGTSFATLKNSASYTFAPGAANTVTVSFPATQARFVRVDITANTGWQAAQLSELEVHAADGSSANLASGRTLTASSHTEVYTAGNANDGNRATYWESANNALPQWIQADLGSSVRVDRVVLRLPDGWGARSQTLKIQGSANGTAFTDLTAAQAYTFDAAGGRAATITFDATTTRYVRVLVTANSVQPAAQLSELEVYGPATGDTQAPSAPANLALTQPATDQIRLTWNASTDNTGVTGYDVYANNVLRGSVAGNVTTYTDSQPASATVTYRVRAKDAAGNQSTDSNAVTRTGSGGSGSNLAVGKEINASSVVHTFVAANANDNNVSTYWEGAGGSYPNTLTVKLGSNADVNSFVLKLNPDTAWATRSQTVEVLGREQSATGFSGIAAAKSYTFDPASGNTVTIPVTARVADVQLKFTANTGSAAGQLAEFQVIGVPAPNPDLEVTGLTTTPASPVESDPITVSATVRNSGPAAAPASAVALRLGGTKVATAQVGALAAGAQTTVSASIGARDAGSYQLSAVADEANAVIEQNESNNTYTRPTALVVAPVSSSDLVAASVTTSPSSPAAGDTVTFKVALKNQGTAASAAGGHGVTLTLTDSTGATVKTLTGTHNGALAAGAGTEVNLGPWTAVNGSYT